MTRRIYRSILLAAVGVMLACLTLLLGVVYSYFGDQQGQELQEALVLAAAGVEAQGAEYLDSLPSSEYRLTWVDADGAVLFDSAADADRMENHAERQEIAQALAEGSGESTRYSSTLTRQTRYFARRLSDGTVLRVSASRMTPLALVLSCLGPVCAIAAAAMLLSGLLASRLSKSIVRPLEVIDLENPLAQSSYPELTPMLTRLENQHRQIREQQANLEKQRQEFRAVTGSMAEGLVLLNPEGKILSINPAARRFFAPEQSPAEAALPDLAGCPELPEIVREAEETGRGERIVSRWGREYQLSASRVTGTLPHAGVVVLIFDVTERVFAERNRREFTANVSHELKTPLQSILGSAELLEKNLVQPEDVPEFLGRIRSESSRMVGLIDDIIRLSQLDEGAALPCEEVALDELARQELAALEPAAKGKQIVLSLEAEHVTLTAPRQLLREILANLCDNAIKYNIPGGSVVVEIFRQDGSAVLRVSDTGIGIAPEHQDRVFERFYRVDKSRSRQIGGTGLGLSIVKHAVLDLGGTVSLRSQPGAGTAITITLPCGEAPDLPR